MSLINDSKNKDMLYFMNKSKLIRISYEEKLNLSEIIQELSPPELTKVVNFIKNKIPRCF